MGPSERRTFLMLKKYECTSDEELVNLFKRGEQDAEIEIIERYKKRARGLASKIYNDFKYAISCEKEDLINCALLSIFKSIKTYTDGKFESYWRTVAKNDVLDMVKKNSISYRGNYNIIEIELKDEIENKMYDELNDPSANNDLFIEELLIFIDRKFPKDNELYKAIFLDLIDGFSINEIAKRYSLKAPQVRYIIEKIREKISGLIIHS